MDIFEIEARKNKINDIKSIIFSDNIQEVLTTMEIVLIMYQIDDDPEIVKASKAKLLEGLNLLKKMGLGDEAKNFDKI
jgi:hypothetical protein